MNTEFFLKIANKKLRAITGHSFFLRQYIINGMLENCTAEVLPKNNPAATGFKSILSVLSMNMYLWRKLCGLLSQQLDIGISGLATRRKEQMCVIFVDNVIK